MFCRELLYCTNFSLSPLPSAHPVCQTTCDLQFQTVFRSKYPSVSPLADLCLWLVSMNICDKGSLNYVAPLQVHLCHIATDPDSFEFLSATLLAPHFAPEAVSHSLTGSEFQTYVGLRLGSLLTQPFDEVSLLPVSLQLKETQCK